MCKYNMHMMMEKLLCEGYIGHSAFLLFVVVLFYFYFYVAKFNVI